MGNNKDDWEKIPEEAKNIYIPKSLDVEVMIESSKRFKERVIEHKKAYEKVQKSFEDYKKRVTENRSDEES